MACITMLNKIGLSTDPWCTPTLTSKLSLSSPFLLTAVVTPSYKLLITFTIHFFTPTCLRAHHKTSRCTLSKAFSKSTKGEGKKYHNVSLNLHKCHDKLFIIALIV